MRTQSGVSRVLLDDSDIRIGAPALDQIGEIKTGGTGAEDGDAHGLVCQTVRPRESRDLKLSSLAVSIV